MKPRILSAPARIHRTRFPNLPMARALVLAILLLPVMSVAEVVETITIEPPPEPPMPMEPPVTARSGTEEFAPLPAAVMAGESGAQQDIFAFPEDGYLVQPGDVLIINVWRETDLQGEALVLPDGTISFPLLDYMHVAGKTLPEIRDGVQERLSRYVSDPVVTVQLTRLSGNLIYVIGNVARPGAVPASRRLDVMQLLSLAGGMSNFAAVNKVKILRRVDGNITVIPFRYRDVEKGVNLEQNIILESGDVVVVP